MLYITTLFTMILLTGVTWNVFYGFCFVKKRFFEKGGIGYDTGDFHFVNYDNY